jgi:hypothetical protein
VAWCGCAFTALQLLLAQLQQVGHCCDTPTHVSMHLHHQAGLFLPLKNIHSKKHEVTVRL